MLSRLAVTSFRAPSPMDTKVITEATPMMTPSMVKAERILLLATPRKDIDSRSKKRTFQSLLLDRSMNSHDFTNLAAFMLSCLEHGLNHATLAGLLLGHAYYNLLTFGHAFDDLGEGIVHDTNLDFNWDSAALFVLEVHKPLVVFLV